MPCTRWHAHRPSLRRATPCLRLQFLEHELKQSYTTKNFTLKSGLLELEKQYRCHPTTVSAAAAFALLCTASIAWSRG